MTNQEKIELIRKRLLHCFNSEGCTSCDFHNEKAMLTCRELISDCLYLLNSVKNIVNEYEKNFGDCTKCIHSQQTEPHVWECEAKEYDIDTKSCWRPKCVTKEN